MIIEGIKVNILEENMDHLVYEWEAYKKSLSEIDLQSKEQEINQVLSDWTSYSKKILDGSLTLDDYTNRKNNASASMSSGYLCNFLEHSTSVFGSSKPGYAKYYEITLNSDFATYNIRSQGQDVSQAAALKFFQSEIKPLFNDIIINKDPLIIGEMIASSGYAAKQILGKVAVLSHLNDFVHIYKEDRINALHKEFIISETSSNMGKSHELRVVFNKLLGINSLLDGVLLSTYLWEYVEPMLASKQLESEFCRWFLKIDGLQNSTLFPYLDALKRIFKDYISMPPFKKDKECQFASAFEITSSLNLKSIISKVKNHGKADLTIHNFRHLKQSLNKYLKFLNQRTTKDKSQITAKDINSKENKMNTPLNQILFGPPGTGKTYSTVIKALSIIESHSEDDLIKECKVKGFKALKERYDHLVKDGQIVFTTFHQSMAYEDFVEGIKPLKPDNEGGAVHFDVVDGVFKNLCINARSQQTNNFDASYAAFIDSINSSDELSELKTNTNKTFWIGVNSNQNLEIYTKEQKKLHGTITNKKLKLHSTGDDFFTGMKDYANSVIEELKLKFGLINTETGSANKQFVLIIDEINRGNVSAIFGELITLIEESKRAGNDEALEIMLPYSKEKFSVPKNLHIIGTMNTADRSVEALDSALRRRFSFAEMQPKPELIETEGNKIRYVDPSGENIDLVNLLQVINDRLEVLLDKDHLIGHSYFMKVSDIESLHHAFYNEIIPLLQEYFFGDYVKISMVLGEGFCALKDDGNQVRFAEVPQSYDPPDYSDKLVFEIKRVQVDELSAAIDTLLLNSKPKNGD